jgi:taurine dioxygenase
MSATAVASTVAFRPLHGEFGCEVLGLDLARPLDAAARKSVNEAFDRRLLLLFRGQTLSEEAHIAFSRGFGPLEVHVLNQYHHGRFPEIYVISNVGPDGKPQGEHPDRGTLVWHTDLSFMRVPSYATILYGVECAAEGGETWFADMLSAYEALPEATKIEVLGLRAVHDLAVSRRQADEDPLTAEQRAKAPPVEHPLVRLHRPTGRRGLYLGSHASHIAGRPVPEGEATIARLLAHATQDRFVYRHRWRPGDLLMWDNRATLHRATGYDTGRERRVMRRTVVAGEVPLAG